MEAIGTEPAGQRARARCRARGPWRVLRVSGIVSGRAGSLGGALSRGAPRRVGGSGACQARVLCRGPPWRAAGSGAWQAEPPGSSVVCSQLQVIADTIGH